MKESPDNNNARSKKGCLRPAIAVIGFFVCLFLAAYLLHLYHARWLIPVGIIAAIGWAVGFSVDWKEGTKNKKDE